MATRISPLHTGSFFKAPRNFCKRGLNGFPIGERTERRQSENKKLGKLKIQRCEIRIQKVCTDRVMLTWAHSQKSRFLLTSQDWQEAARCCLPCHVKLEEMSHSEMKQRVVEAISKRKKEA